MALLEISQAVDVASPEASGVENLTLIKRAIPWQDHHPHQVTTFASIGKKNVTDKILTVEGFSEKLSPQEAYHLAKQLGNREAAHAYADYILGTNPEVLQELVQKHAHQNPLILPVTGIERMEGGVYKHNAIPEAFAILLSQYTGWKVHGEGSSRQIIQSSKAGRTGANKIDRFVRQAYFEGDVEPNRNYIILDDHVTNGGTIRNLMDYVESNGGRVIAASALIRGAQDNSFRPSEKTINRIRQVVGYNNFGALHNRIFGRPSHEMMFTSVELSNIKVIFDEEYIPALQKEHATANEALAAAGKKELPFPKGKELQDKFYNYLISELNHVAQTRLQQSRTFGAYAGTVCPRAANVDRGGESTLASFEPGRHGSFPLQDSLPAPRDRTAGKVRLFGSASSAAIFSCN